MKNIAIKLGGLICLCLSLSLSGCKSISFQQNKVYSKSEILTLILSYEISKTTNPDFRLVYAAAMSSQSYEMVTTPVLTEIIYPFDGQKAYFAEFSFRIDSKKDPIKGFILCSDGEFEHDSFKSILRIKAGDQFKMVPDERYFGKEIRIAWVSRADDPIVR